MGTELHSRRGLLRLRELDESLLIEEQAKRDTVELLTNYSTTVRRVSTEYLSTEETAAMLGVCITTVYRMVKRGELTAKKVKGKLRIAKEVVESVTDIL